MIINWWSPQKNHFFVWQRWNLWADTLYGGELRYFFDEEILMEISEFRKVEKMPKMYIFCQVQWQDHDWARRTYNTKFYANKEQELKQIIKNSGFFLQFSTRGVWFSQIVFFSKQTFCQLCVFSGKKCEMQSVNFYKTITTRSNLGKTKKM